MEGKHWYYNRESAQYDKLTEAQFHNLPRGEQLIRDYICPVVTGLMTEARNKRLEMLREKARHGEPPSTLPYVFKKEGTLETTQQPKPKKPPTPPPQTLEESNLPIVEPSKEFNLDDIEDVWVILKVKGAKKWLLVSKAGEYKEWDRDLRIKLGSILLLTHAVVELPNNGAEEKLREALDNHKNEG